MGRYEKLGCEIIDDVIDAILEQNPEIDTTDKEGDTLLYGEAYYDLESSIAERIREFSYRTHRGGELQCVSRYSQD